MDVLDGEDMFLKSELQEISGAFPSAKARAVKKAWATYTLVRMGKHTHCPATPTDG